MVQGWVTTLVLAFGIVVAIIGVIAYLKMFGKDRLSATSRSAADVPPPITTIPARSTDIGQNSHSAEAISEQATQQD